MSKIIPEFTSVEGSAILSACMDAKVLCDHADSISTILERNGDTLMVVPVDEVGFLGDLKSVAATKVAGVRNLLRPKLDQPLPARSRLLQIDKAFRQLHLGVEAFQITTGGPPFPKGTGDEKRDMRNFRAWARERNKNDCPPHIRDPEDSIYRSRSALSALQKLIFVGPTVQPSDERPLGCDEIDFAILAVLRSNRGRVLNNREIQAQISTKHGLIHNEKTIRERLKLLNSLDFICRPAGKKRGWVITTKGDEFYNQYGKGQP